MSGNNNALNLVELTAREHFICHWLLSKMTTGADRSAMIHALMSFRWGYNREERYDTPITSRVYENLKIEYAKVVSKQWLGVAKTAEHKQNISVGRTAFMQTKKGIEWKRKTSQTQMGNINGKYKSIEGLKRCGDAKRGTKTPKKLCPHCDRLIAVNTYPRWHGDNCKNKP